MVATGFVIPYKSGLSKVGVGVFRLGVSCYVLAIAMFFFGITTYGGDYHAMRGPLFAMLDALGLVEADASHFCSVSVSLLTLLGVSMVMGSIFLRVSAIGLNADLIQFPRIFNLALLGRTERLWTDVSYVGIEGSSDSPLGKLTMLFRSGGVAIIDLRLIDASDLEQLLLFIETRATLADKSTEFELLLDNVHDQKINKGELSFTELWQTDMNRSFAPVAFSPKEPGDVLQDGNLKVVRHLAFGGFSAVYLAQRGQDRVILKEAVIPSGIDSTDRQKAEEMLDRESNLLLRLSHPNIVGVRDYFKENGRSYLVLDYLAGQNLRHYVKSNGPQAEVLVLDWARQLTQILFYLHEHDPPIIHRDISPDNLMLREDNKLVLIDFGAANEFLSAATGTIVGKQSYIPPEQFKGKSVPQSDLYGFGATLHFLLTGEDPEPLCQSHPVEVNADVSEKMNSIVAACTDLDLETRLKSAKDLAALLDSDSSDGSVIKWKTKQLS